MYASIHRYEVRASLENDPAELGWDLVAVLARSPRFVAAVVVEDETGALFTIRLFEDQASLVGATPTADGWVAQQAGILQSSATEVAIGEVVAQKGL